MALLLKFSQVYNLFC